VIAAVAIAIVVLGALILGPRSGISSSDSNDPASTGPTGTKALVLLLRESGAQVSVSSSMPASDHDVALLLSDTTTASQRAALQRWVSAGGVLVVADPASTLAPLAQRSTSLLTVEQVGRGDCDIGVLGNLGELFAPAGATTYSVPSGSGRCFASGDQAVVVDTPSGAGHIVSIGSASVFWNQSLDQDDNAGLAVNLMAPVPGTRVSVLWGMTGDGGGRDVSRADSLVSTGVQLALLQLLVAFVVYSLWRGRRLGRVVHEPQPVSLGGSELTSAHGRLLQQSADPDRSARLLRHDLRRQLSERLGLPRDATPTVLAEVVATRTGIDRDVLARVVTDVPVPSDDELLALARDIDSIRSEVFHA
jgi:hypothetical protein